MLLYRLTTDLPCLYLVRHVFLLPHSTSFITPSSQNQWSLQDRDPFAYFQEKYGYLSECSNKKESYKSRFYFERERENPTPSS